jgi:lysophospholipase L1-like esterase
MEQIKIDEQTRKLDKQEIIIGYTSENKTESIKFEIPDKYKNYNKKACFRTDEKEFSLLIGEDNILTLTSDITKFKQVDMAIEFFADDIVARTSVLRLIFRDTVTGGDVLPSNPKVIILNELIQQVNNLDVDLEGTNLTITKKDGTKKSVELSVKNGKDGSNTTTNTNVTGTFIKIKDAEEGSTKGITIKSGASTKIIRVGSNFFDGILSVGFYGDKDLNISPNALFRSFTINLPKGSYTLCFDKSVAIIKRKINNEFISANVEDIKTFGFILTNGGNVSFSFRNNDRSNWSNNQKVWIIRGSENMVYSEYKRQEVSIENAGTLTLLNGENNIFTNVDDAKLELTYIPNQILYMKNLIQNNSINHIVGLIRSGEITKIKVIGDSITHGVGGAGFQVDYGDGKVICVIDAMSGSNGVSFKVNTKGECWANSFKKYIETKYPYVTVNCWGTRGMSAHSWLTRGHTENNVFKNCVEQLITDEDELVICMIGTNDRSQGANIEEFNLNMTTIINYILGKGKKLLLMSSLPASLSNENDGTQHFNMEDVNNSLCNFANNYNLWFVSLYNEVNKYLRNSKTSLNSILGDGLHPNDEGYDLMYKLLLENLGFGVPTK